MATLSLGLVDPDRDDNRSNPDVHYRLYDHPEHGPAVVCVQDFDYPDYDGTRFLTYDSYTGERDAEAGLRNFALAVRTLADRIQKAGLL